MNKTTAQLAVRSNAGLCKHWLDKPILRDMFWFIVLPHRLKMFVAAQEPLPPEMAKVLNDNLWDLYESDTLKAGCETATKSLRDMTEADFDAVHN